MNMLKKTYHLVAALALLNLLAMGAIAVHLAGQGQLTAEKLRSVVELFKPQPAEAAGDAQATPAGKSPEPGAAPAPMTPSEREIARLNLERVTRAAEDQLKYSSRMMVDIERRREELKRQKQELEQAEKAAESAAAEETFQKELEVLSMLKPKIALDNLLALDMDTAASYLRAMDARTAKKIVEASSKDPAKWGQMLQIQEKMRMDLPSSDGAEQGAAPQASPAP